ncbi:MAG TPA: class I SAM-dependent methyltransferase [Elusimicrobiota bacterium]|jgi:SAM-dependent methyltransferase|nr:class I SAM-dependent methyltransferase [Elusimicrobiota bacterium]
MEQAKGLSTMSPAMEDARNYSAWLFDALRPLLGRRVLEIGPGYGGVARLLVDAGVEYRAIDSDAAVIANLRPRLTVPADRLNVGDVTEPAWGERLRREGTDTILLLNVLEHIEDDRAFLRAAARCAPGGRLAILVPAMPALYGTFDSQAGHFRRYAPGALRGALAGAGLRVRSLSYFNAVGAASWLLSARVLKLPIDSPGTARSILLYDRFVVPAARFVDPVLRLFAGQSLLASADIPA